MKYRILLVDDEKYFLEIMSDFLSDENYEIETASNGNEALSILAENQFDLIVSDINMPGIKGFELLNKVSQLYPYLKRVLITAYDVSDYVYLAKNHNISNIITKTTPLNFREIKVFLKNILTNNIFGLGKYIKGTIYQRSLKSVHDIENIFSEVLTFMHKDRHKRKFKQALGEIILNAFLYGAQTNQNDKDRRLNHAIELGKEEEIVISWGGDNTLSGVAVTDQKGHLTRKEILYWLERNTCKGKNGLSLGITDTHGKGIFIARETIDRLIINIHPGKMTEVVLLNYEKSAFYGYRPLWIQEI